MRAPYNPLRVIKKNERQRSRLYVVTMSYRGVVALGEVEGEGEARDSS